MSDCQDSFVYTMKARKLERDLYDLLMHGHAVHLRGNPSRPCTEELIQWRAAMRDYLDCSRHRVRQARDTRDASLLVHENPLSASQDEKSISG
jgi:hypothetical protein